MGGRQARRWDADRGVASEWRCHNARVASGRRLAPADRRAARPPFPEAPAKRSEDAALLDKLLSALLALPPDELSWLIYYRLPGELGERLRDRMKPEKRAWFPSRSR